MPEAFPSLADLHARNPLHQAAYPDASAVPEVVKELSALAEAIRRDVADGRREPGRDR